MTNRFVLISMRSEVSCLALRMAGLIKRVGLWTEKLVAYFQSATRSSDRPAAQ